MSGTRLKERVQLPSALVGAALAYAAARGADAKGIASKLGIPEIQNGEPPIVTARQTRELLDAVAAALADPLLGIHIAQKLPRGLYGVLEYACRSAPDVRGGLDRLTRYVALVSAPAVADLLRSDEGGAALRFRFPGVRGTLGRHGNEFFMAIIWLRAREFSGVSFRPRRVTFEHAPPADRKAVEAFFETSVIEYSAEYNELHLDDTTLALPIVSHEPNLLPLLDKMAEQEVAARKGGLVDNVSRQIRATLEQGEPALDDVAKALGMSGRTLQRRLNDEEAPFAEVVDSIRNELACLYVREPERSLDDVARLLGYAGARPFQRAFKRWTGMTPLEYRRLRD